jgi:hypothetical protein
LQTCGKQGLVALGHLLLVGKCRLQRGLIHPSPGRLALCRELGPSSPADRASAVAARPAVGIAGPRGLKLRLLSRLLPGKGSHRACFHTTAEQSSGSQRGPVPCALRSHLLGKLGLLHLKQASSPPCRLMASAGFICSARARWVARRKAGLGSLGSNAACCRLRSSAAWIFLLAHAVLFLAARGTAET